MEAFIRRAVSFPDWPQNPIRHFNLSAGGLIALADLGTVSQRTALVGGASWLDSLLLAPGLHYQQAADSLVDGSTLLEAVELADGRMTTYSVSNPATLNYLRRVSRPGETVTVDVGTMPIRTTWRRSPRQSKGQRGRIMADQSSDLGWVSHYLYLASPVLTIVAIVFMVLIQDWWALASILALMLSRVLNIWVIKQRARPPPLASLPAHDAPGKAASRSTDPNCPVAEPPNLLTSYVIHLKDRTIRLRGLSTDLQAITTTNWLSTKSHIEGYLEAMAKLCVWVVAAFSGNLTQVGGIILMGLLLVSAGLLGLSNAHAKSFKMHGRVAAPTKQELDVPYRSGGGGGGAASKGKSGSSSSPYPPAEGVKGGKQASGMMGESWSELDDGKARRGWAESSRSSGFAELDDWAERGQIGGAVRDRWPFEQRVDYN